MESGRTTPSIEALLANASWMRSLALAIVRDPTLADDLVQDAWVVALERPPQPRSAAGLRAWLSAVVSNLAHGRRRRESGRETVERSAARPEATAGDLDAVQRLELQRELTEVLLEVREPCRTAVILRHLEGLSSEEIARRSNCSAETARQRVTRGLSELRRRLQSRPNRRGANPWLALVQLARAPHSITAGSVGSGVLLMSKSTWSVVSIAFGFLAAWLAWSALHATAPSVPSPSDGLARDSTAIAASDANSAARLSTQGGEPSNARSSAQLPEAEAHAIAVIRDRNGSPLDGISICPRGSTTPLGKTNEDGRFDLPWASIGDGEAAIAATAVHDDFLSAELELAPRKTVELTLARKPRVVFELAAPDDAAVERPWSASVWVRDAVSGEVVQVYAETEGELCARRLPVGRLERAEARARGFATGQGAFQLQLEPDSVQRVRIELRRGLEVSGRVVDKSTREPIAGATVWSESAFFVENSVTAWETTDAQGHFELHGLESQSLHDDTGQAPVDLVWAQVSAKAEGYQGKLLDGHVMQKNETGRYFVELELTRTSCRLHGRLLGLEGLTKPIVIMAVSERGQLSSAYAQSDGRFQLEDLEPGLFNLFASNSNSYEAREPEVSDPRACGRLQVNLEAGEDKEVELVLERGSASASGRVVNTRGEPVANVEVHANMTERQGMIAWGPFHWSAITNATGDFVFDGLLAGEYSLEFGEVPRNLCIVENFTPFTLAPGGHQATRPMLLSECVSVEGWVELNGHDPAGLRVQARAPGDQGLRVESPVAADTSFRLVRLPGVALDIVLLEGDKELLRLAVGSQGARGVRLVIEN